MSKPTPATRCLNCDAPVTGRFCAACGQRTDVGPLRTWPLLRSAVGAVLDVDSRPIGTVRRLLWRPGRVAAAYVRGERTRYANPVKFCLFVAILAPIVTTLVMSDGPGTVGLVEPQITGDDDAVTATLDDVNEWFGVLLMVLLLPVAMLMSLVARAFGERRRVAEWYVVGLYAYGIAVLFQFIFSLLAIFAPWVAAANGLLPLVWYAWAVYDFVDPARGRGRRLGLTAASIVLQILGMLVGALILVAFARLVLPG